QPVDYRVISGPLGDEGAFLRMTEAAHRAGLKVIVDAVLNHMANSRALEDLHFPAFGPEDFHFAGTRPDIVHWDDRREVVTHWLEGLPDLATETRHVRDEQYNYLRKLVSLGADGFRYDAAKHIEPGYFHEQLARLPGGL